MTPRACPACLRRASLLAMLAPAIERTQPLTRQSLLALLALGDEQLCRAVAITDPHRLLRKLQTPRAARDSHGAPSALCRHDPDYPVALAQLDSAPATLFTSSSHERLRDLLSKPTVAIVGEQHHTHYAHQVAFALARDLAHAGITILSGLHQGIDAIAHHGALHAHGHTIAVTACDPERPYPRQLDHLHHHIRANGTVLSELPPGFHPPRRWCLLASQRTIAALADIIVIVEARERSSALLAAHTAADLGRDVAAVPGRVTDPGAHGTLALLRDGAHPVAHAQDILDLIPTKIRQRELTTTPAH